MPDRDEIESVIDKLMEVIWNQRQLDRMPEVFHPDTIYHTINGDIEGMATFRDRYISPFVAAFPDMHHTLTALLIDGDRASIRMRGIGKHTAAFNGKEPTGKVLDYTAAAFFRFDGGKIAEVWTFSNAMQKIEAM